MWVTFNAYVSYGKIDSADFDIELDLTEEEYDRLRESSKNHFRMKDDPAVADIYQEAYDLALSIDVDAMRDNKDMLADRMAWFYNISYEEALERDYSDEEIEEMLEAEGTRGISYPQELEEERDNEDDE